MRVPGIDIAGFSACSGTPDQRIEIARQVDNVCRSLGFLVVSGHGVSSNLVQRAYRAYAQFFELSLADKMQVQGSGYGPGYRPVESTALARSRGAETPSDLNERFTIAPVRGDKPADTAAAAEWFPTNRWPAEPVEFRPTITEYFLAMENLARTLMRIFAVGLDLPETFFNDAIDKPISRLTGIHYPPLGFAPRTGQLRAGEHTDYGSLTILHKQPGATGLQVRDPAGGWIDVDPVEDAFIVNIGDLLAEWTNDRWVSTMHRVANPDASDGVESARLSIAFFHQPNFDALVAPLRTCVSAEAPPRYAPTTSGEHLATKLGRSVTSTATP